MIFKNNEPLAFKCLHNVLKMYYEYLRKKVAGRATLSPDANHKYF